MSARACARAEATRSLRPRISALLAWFGARPKQLHRQRQPPNNQTQPADRRDRPHHPNLTQDQRIKTSREDQNPHEPQPRHHPKLPFAIPKAQCQQRHRMHQMVVRARLPDVQIFCAHLIAQSMGTKSPQDHGQTAQKRGQRCKSVRIHYPKAYRPGLK